MTQVASHQPEDLNSIVKELRAFQAKSEERFSRLESLVNDVLLSKKSTEAPERPKKVSGYVESTEGTVSQVQPEEGNKNPLTLVQEGLALLQKQHKMHAPLFSLLQQQDGGVEAVVATVKEVEYVREMVEVCGRRSELAVEHAKSLMDTAVAGMHDKLGTKIDIQQYQNADHEIREVVESLKQHVASLAAQVADPPVPAKMQEFLAEVGGIGLGRRLETMERKMNTHSVLMKELKPNRPSVIEGGGTAAGNFMTEDFEAFRNEIKKAILDIKVTVETKPTSHEVGKLVEKKMAQLQTKHKRFSVEGVAMLSKEVFDLTMADLKTQIANKISQMESSSLGEAQKLSTLEGTVQALQESLADSMSRKANRVQVEEELSNMLTNFNKMGDVIERLSKHKADAKDTIRMQRALQDLATLQKMASRPALLSKSEAPCLSCDGTGGAGLHSPRPYDTSQSVGFNSANFSPGPEGRKNLSPGPESPGFYRNTHAKMNVLDSNKMLSADGASTGNSVPGMDFTQNNMFVPTSTKPPATFHTNKRNLGGEAELRNKGLLRDLPPVHSPPYGRKAL